MSMTTSGAARDQASADTVGPVGSHVPTAGGLAKRALAFAAEIGAEVVQVFVGNPRGWATSPGDPGQDEGFRAGCEQAGIPAYVHAPYLVNLGSPTELTARRSAESLAHSIARGVAIGARGVVAHTGSAVDAAHREAAMRQVREALLPLLDAVDTLAARHGVADGAYLLVEPTAGAGESLCATVADLGPYFDALERHPRLGVCLDTCHAFAAGHDLATPGGARATVDELLAVVGPDRLRLVHANDSKDPVGSRRDRHERIGHGRIGADAFRELLAHPATRGVPVVLETPGSPADYRADMALVRALRDGEPA